MKPSKRSQARAPRNPRATKESVCARKRAVALFRALEGVDYQDDELQWDALLEFLNLPLCYQPAAKLALADGRWKRSLNPKAYVATVAYRIAINENLIERPIDAEKLGRCKIDIGPLSGVMNCREYSGGTPMSDVDFMDYMWEAYGDFDESDWEVIPDWLRVFGDQPTLVDWNRVAKCAVRKEKMADAVSEVLQLRARGVQREAALRSARDDRDRLQAAWRWVDRNWESRIVPLFRQHHPPSPTPAVPARKKREKQEERMVPPWEVLRKLSERRAAAR